MTKIRVDFKISPKRTEDELVRVAQWHPDDGLAYYALEELRRLFDVSYFYCWDCEGLLTTRANCCLNQSYEEPITLDEEYDI